MRSRGPSIPPRPPQNDGQRRPIYNSSQQVQSLDRHCRLRKPFCNGDVQTAIGEPIRNGFLAVGLFDGRTYAVPLRGRASLVKGIDGGELGLGQPGGGERARRSLRIIQTV